MARHGAAMLVLFCCALAEDDGLGEGMIKYVPKSCKYNLLPESLSSRAYTTFTGEVKVFDVYGLPSIAKRHLVKVQVEQESYITLSAEVHRDTPATLRADVYRADSVGTSSGRVLWGSNLVGSGGEDTKSFLHGVLGGNEQTYEIVLQLFTVEVAAAQLDAHTATTSCWPVRLDLTIVPASRALLQWPSTCSGESRLPPSLSSDIVILKDDGLKLELNGRYVYRFGEERPWEGFKRAVWSGTLEVPARLHRFARFFFRISFRFASAPLQLILELFDLKDTPDSTALAPSCLMGCLGGVPVYNGQIFDHAMPTGFRYKIWLMAARLDEWVAAVPDSGRHCLEFDLDYTVRYEERLTPFEVGPAAWLCEASRLPSRIIQSPDKATLDSGSDGKDVVQGRSIWFRDRFGFPPDEVSDMHHEISMSIRETVLFRATTHHSEGVDVFLGLRRVDALIGADLTTTCKPLKHPGPVPRQTIFCQLVPGEYVLTFFADYPLGGLHPCNDFFAQVALRPVQLIDQQQTPECLDSSHPGVVDIAVEQSSLAPTTARWKEISFGMKMLPMSAVIGITTSDFVVTPAMAKSELFLRVVVLSDYVSTDLRFQVKTQGQYVADTQVTTHGYADMLGPLEAGNYILEFYYASGVGPTGEKHCRSAKVDVRLVSRASYANQSALWLCQSIRVPPPDMLKPLPDEQVLLDSEYMIPKSGMQIMDIVVTEERLLRVQATSTDAEFSLRLWSSTDESLADGERLELVIPAGKYVLSLRASVNSLTDGKTCPVYQLNMLLQPVTTVPSCPWAPSSSFMSSSSASSAQVQASDHIGNVLIDLIPAHPTKDLTVKPPVSLWMSEGMEKSFEMTLEEASALRLDVNVRPPFLPLEVTVRRKRASGKLEPPVSSGIWMESRLLLLANELPRGTYTVDFRQPRRYKYVNSYGNGRDVTNYLCAHVTVFAEVGAISKETINQMRNELLQLPDLLAVQPFPPSFNTVGWFSSALSPVLGTSVYRFPEGKGVADLKVDDECVLRVLCEPADLSNSNSEVAVRQSGSVIATSDDLGALVVKLEPGKYEVSLRPWVEGSPFLVTMGIGTVSRMKEDLLLQDSGQACVEQFPDLVEGNMFVASGWTVGPSLVRLTSRSLSRTGTLGSMTVELQVPSVLFIEAGSTLPLDLVRISLSVPEGLWIGEQRGLRNSLQIEAPPGKYTVNIGQPKPVSVAVERCLEFSVFVSAKPLNPDAISDEKEADVVTKIDSGGAEQKELGAREVAQVEAAACFSMGTIPLPLDLTVPQGGSTLLGGPLKEDGRLLVRSKVMITDMHDGRKKTYLATSNQKLILKVGVTLGHHARLSTAQQLSLSVLPVGGKAGIDATEMWATDGGWERVYILSEDHRAFWLTFHHPHEERSESSCIHFALEIEIHPYSDMRSMLSCKGSSAPAERLFPTIFEVGSAPFNFHTEPLNFVSQGENGFLTTTNFRLAQTSWVGVDLSFNFLMSHAEADIIGTHGDNALVFAETDFVHESDHILNSRQVLGRTLPAGDYTLRIADDHWKGQFQDMSEGCFPFALDMVVVPEGSAASVVYVHPSSSVPVVRGLDMVITIRFSDAPRGTLEEVVDQFSLGGVRAWLGGSIKHMQTRYANDAARKISVQASAAEGNHMWVITWSSHLLSTMSGSAELSIGKLVSNVTGQGFNFAPLTYTFVDAPKGEPWFSDARNQQNGQSWSPWNANPSPPIDEGLPRQAGSGSIVGVSRPEGSGSVMPRPESALREQTQPILPAVREQTQPILPVHEVARSREVVPQQSGSVGMIRQEGISGGSALSRGIEDHGPVIVDYRPPPMSMLGGGIATTVLTTTTSISASRFEPLGYRTISAGSFVAFLVLYYLAGRRTEKRGKPSVSDRFRDIGERRDDEELSLVPNSNFNDDDEML